MELPRYLVTVAIGPRRNNRSIRGVFAGWAPRGEGGRSFELAFATETVTYRIHNNDIVGISRIDERTSA